MSIEIFVRSRGYSPDFDYCWQPNVPLSYSVLSFHIQSESPSIVLARFKNKKQLILLVTGLKSPKKRDFRDRPIRHSVAWICEENDDNEKLIRAIAIEALNGSLAERVDSYIHFGGESGFKVDDIRKLSDSLSNEGEDLPPELVPKIGNNSEELRGKLIHELHERRLPKRDQLPERDPQFIVVVTGFKSETALEEAGAWRSLSNLVESKDWKLLSSSEVELWDFYRAAIAVAIVALILLVILLSPLTQKPEEDLSPPTLPPTNQEAEEYLPMEQKSSAKDLMSSQKELNTASELSAIGQFIARHQDIRRKVERGELSDEDRTLLRQAKADLEKNLRLIEQFENLSHERF